MRHFIPLLLLLSSLNGQVAASYIPTTLQILNNNTFSEHSPSLAINSTGALTTFTPPEGIQIRKTWDHNVRLIWFEVFVNTIETMLGAAQLPWEGLVHSFEDTTSPTFTSRLQIGALHVGLQVKHCISALYETGLTMAATHNKDKLFAGIVVDRVPLGFLRYDIKPPGSLYSASNGTDLSLNNTATRKLSTTLIEKQSNSSTLSVGRSGTVRNPLDPKFEVYFEFPGEPASPSAIFTAFVDAIAITAQYDNNALGGEVSAWSTDRTVSLIMRRDQGIATFTWGDVKSALSMLWRQIIVDYDSPNDPNWQEVTFLIKYDGSTIGDGFIA